jgi:hypothetical protein
VRLTLRYSIYDDDIFERKMYPTQVPAFKPEFLEWANITMGGVESIPVGNMVRSRDRRGAGNRGGWEWKPYWMDFVFDNDAEHLVFKMKWPNEVQTPAKKKKRIRRG